jgi:murein DD-endopeptidase MepM/ murein hydrolase activator NlpD
VKKLIIATALLATLNSFAQQEARQSPIFYWDNQEHLVQIDESKCHITKVPTNRFRVSKYFGEGTNHSENLRNRYGRRTSYLPNGSLVKNIPSTHKLRNYEPIEVVGINRLSDSAPRRWSSKRLDRGYLFHKSLHPIDDYAMRLDMGAPMVKMGEIRNNLTGTFIRVVVEDSYFQLHCPEFEEGRDYILFRAYDEFVQDKPIAFVAVYWDETAIFRSFQMFSKNDAHRFVNDILFEDRLENELEGRITFDAPPIQNTDREAEDDERIEADDNMIDDHSDNDSSDTTLDAYGQANNSTSFDYRVCTSGGTLNIRNEKLNRILFRAKNGEKVKIFQGWGNNTQQRIIYGISYTFLKVQFYNRESSQKVGWAAERFIQTRENCESLVNPIGDDLPTMDNNQNITSLDDPDCCEFPTVKKVTHRFNSGMRRFGAGRSGGNRLHAACDLYRYKDEPVLSVAPGVVLRNKYYFYQGTYALEVKHAGGFVVRYGEITGKSPIGTKQGMRVKTGQRIGYIGKVNSNCCRPMLHFELFRGNKSGSLSTSGNRFNRRSDLMDPTDYLQRWEDRNF